MYNLHHSQFFFVFLYPLATNYETKYEEFNNYASVSLLPYSWSSDSRIRCEHKETRGSRTAYDVWYLHKGDGLYEGDVTFFMDPNHLDEGEFLTFTIFTVRGATGPYDLNYTAKRSGWNEGRYGSSENAIRVQDGEVLTDLLRGADRQWWMVWDNENDTQSYHITFDMNVGSVSIKKNIDDPDGINIIDPSTNFDFASKEVYDLSGRRVSKPVKGMYIVNGKKIVIR